MKRIITALLVAFASVSCSAQIVFPIDSTTHKVTFSEIVQVDSISKPEIFTKVNEWIALNFVSTKDVVQFSDKENGKIILKGIIHAFCGKRHEEFGGWKFVLTIDIKDNKYRYVFTDFYHERPPTQEGGSVENLKPACGGLHMFQSAWTTSKYFLFTDVTALISSMKKYVSEKNSKW